MIEQRDLDTILNKYIKEYQGVLRENYGYKI